jgi:hypothetical protein
MYKIFLTLTIAVSAAISVHGQVTIGSDIDPQKGVMLNLQDQIPNSDNETVHKGGLGMPRVKLVNRNTLEPFIAADDKDWVANTGMMREHHAGLMVYNINATEVKDNSDLETTFRLGFYIWNGKQWKEAQFGKESFFALPLFNFDLTAGTHTVNLYSEYKAQYAATGRLYALAEMDFAVTYYNKDVIEIKSLLPNGDLSYTIIKTPVLGSTPEVFINAVVNLKRTDIN